MDTHRTALIAAVASRRVFRVTELEQLGVSQSTSYRRAQPGGPWTRLLPGIVLVESGPPTADDLIQAALLRAGPRALITGFRAAKLHGLKMPPDDADVHVLVPHGKKLQNYPGFRFERTKRLPDPVIVETIPVAPLTRAVMDAARTWQPRAVTEELIVEAVQHTRSCHPDRLTEEMERGCRRGTRMPRKVLRSITADIRSLPEFRAHELLQRSGLPEPQWNIRLFSGTGEFIACPDAWFDDVGLAVEIDSVQFHFSKSDYAMTLRRNNRYSTHGVSAVQVLPRRLRAEPEAVLEEIRRAHGSAAARARPDVVAYGPGSTGDRARAG
ncbi:hypothetical protein [Saccharopolyspora cebuensis]|uniref:Transcriptional regulator, AbiEi antitoxin, Type IV TA system n=1 Tax=Saccharopolyspora cebuensis TaxID=418759 RepID=A0ABV4CEA0_9PSEU